MSERFFVLGVVAFAATIGFLVVAWLRGRSPATIDDPSILAAGPPPAMTAATATIVSGGPVRTAFMAALLDLASRDEIEFRREGTNRGVDRVGIAIHGTETGDERVLRNRRRPIGEAEAWLLAQLRVAPSIGDLRRVVGLAPAMGPLSALAGGMGLASMLTRAGMATADGDDSEAAREQREHGLTTGPPLDAATLERAYETRKGHPMPEAARERLETMMAAAASATASTLGAPGEPEDATANPADLYITAEEARRLRMPILFGTMLERYASRHGWLAGLGIVRRLAWRAIGWVELAAGLALVVVGSEIEVWALVWIGFGLAAGGLVTLPFAPVVARRTPAGAMVRAQLAAYGRTLHATFASAGSMDDVVAGSRLAWLESPDQVLAWGIALGLQWDVEQLLARSSPPGAETASAPGPAEVLHDAAARWFPWWYATHEGAAKAPGAAARVSLNPAAMFAGIEAIGSETGTGLV
jgi:hypothetical protein